MAEHTHIYEAPSDKVISLLKDAEIDNRTQDQIIEGFKNVDDRIIFEYEIVPCHLKLKSKIFRMKKSTTTIDKLSLNRTYLHKDDYNALHERVIKEQVQRSTVQAIGTRVANLSGSLDGDIYVHDTMYMLDGPKSASQCGSYIYILSVEIKPTINGEIGNRVYKTEELRNFIGDVLQHTVFNVNVLVDRTLMVKPIMPDQVEH